MVTVPTTAGEVGAGELGVVLVREPLFNRSEALQQGWPGFGGWDADAEVAAARERLTELYRAGVGTIMDLTVPGQGRDPLLVARAADGTGLKVAFATGFAGYGRLPLPLRGPAGERDENLLENLLERDLTAGIRGVGIRAAVLSVAVGEQGLTEDTERLARAVAAVSARTGAVICARAHAGTRRGLDQQRVFAEHGVDPARVLVGGCADTTDLSYHEELIAAGCWLGWDSLGHSAGVPLGAQLDALAQLCRRGHAGRVMLSQGQPAFSDAGGGRGLPGGQYARGHGQILAGLRDRGVPADQVEQMLVASPREFLLLGQPVTAPAAGGAPGPAGGRRRVTVMDNGEVGAAAEPGSLVGRVRELGELRQLARATRLLTLCGPGGTGKTRLLQELVPALADEYPDGTFLVGLDDLQQPDLLAARVALITGVSHEPGVALPDTLAEALRDRRLVIGLDGCQRLAAACADLCLRLLASAPGLMIIASSRRPLGVAAEVIWHAPPLSLPDAGETDPLRAAAADAVRLFAARAAAADDAFVLDAASCPAVVSICQVLAGLPLAIELAAARVRELDVTALAARLADQLAVPGSPAGRMDVARQRATLRAAVDWSHDMLAPAERALLRRLSVFAGWSLEMAERVCADDSLPPARIHGLLASLSDHALIQLDASARSGDRYRMQGAIRDYAAARLVAAGESEVFRRRLRDFVAQQVEYLTSIGKARVPVTWQAFRKLFRGYQADIRNIRAVLSWCLEHGDIDTGLWICTELGICWIAGGAHDEGDRWLAEFLDDSRPPAPPAVRGPALAVRAQLVHFRGDSGHVLEWGSAALELCRAAGDLHYTVIALNVLSQTALAAGRAQESIRLADEALEQARRNGDQWNEVYALNNRAAALHAAGRLAESRDCSEASLALALDTEQHWGAALARFELGDVNFELGDLDASRNQFLVLLAFTRQAMTRPDSARCLRSLGTIALAQDDLKLARENLTESLRLSLRAGGREHIASGLLALADLAVAEENPARAVQLAAAASALRQSAHLPPLPAEAAARYAPGALASLGLPADEAARLWSAGLDLPTHEAAQLALEPPT